MEINRRTMTKEILKEIKGSKEYFENNNMACLSCLGLANETLEKSCTMHGLDVDKVIEDLIKINNK